MEHHRVPRKPVAQSSSRNLLVDAETASQREAARIEARRGLTGLSNTSNEEQSSHTRRSLWSFFRYRRTVEAAPVIDETKDGSDEYLAPVDAVQEEIVDLETHWPLISDEKMRALAQDFHPPTQLRHLLLHGLRRWLLTAALIASMIAVIWKYSEYAVLSEQDKNTYNFLTIGLSIALGMAIASSLKAMAVNFRWWLLSLRKRSPREVDLILHIDSLTECARLALHSPRLSLACLLWLALNIGLQVAVAAIGLTYSAETSSKFGKPVAGNVTIPDMSEIFTENFMPGSDLYLADSQYTANVYGQIGLSFNSTTIENLPDPLTLWTSPDKSRTLFYDDSRKFWQYNFVESNPEWSDDDQGYITVYTDRSINVTWKCESWVVIKGGNGSVSNIELLISSNGIIQNATLPVPAGLNQTTFITLDNNKACGPAGSGCFRVSAFEASLTHPWYYTCNMTVSTVANATIPEHRVGEDLRELAAEAIALQGFTEDDNDLRQFQTYPAASFQGSVQSGDANEMGFLIGRFSIGVIAAAATFNPFIELPGQQPTKGSSLTVNWRQLIAIMAALGGTQALLVILTSFVANLVVVKDDSFLAIARTLRPLVDRLGPAGSMAGGKEIAEALSDGGATKVVYSVRHPQKGNIHHLDLGLQKRLRAFPRGDYD